MSCTRYVNSSPTWSLLPSTSSPHHPRTSLMASKTRSGVWSTTNEAVKSFTIRISFYLHGACLTESRYTKRAPFLRLRRPALGRCRDWLRHENGLSCDFHVGNRDPVASRNPTLVPACRCVGFPRVRGSL